MWRVLFFLAVIFIVPTGQAASPTAGHSWERIDYPPLIVKGVPGHLSLSVDSGSHDSVSHLRFSIHWGTSRDQLDGKPADAVAEPSKILVRLHLADGKMVLPEKSGIDNWLVIGGRGLDWSLLYFFPWGDNELSEGWIELTLRDQTFWVELPYGFTRRPSDPLLDDPEHGLPMFPPAMGTLPASDVLIPWIFVEYDIGEIQNHWRLSLHVSNPFTARAEAILYKENGAWDLHTPQTAIQTQWKNGSSNGRCVGVRLTDLFRRADDHLLGGGPEPEKGRIWGKLVVKVDGQNYECVVPSSLFKYTHGITGPYNKQRLPRTRPPDGDF